MLRLAQKIGVEQEHEFRLTAGVERVREPVVHVARFRVLALDAPDVMRASLAREVRHPIARAIAERRGPTTVSG
ncbi:MAG TPA: hypothetical protein VHS58_07665 [Acetobacteraceae bacterium]|jgi:hypothetical protein|nr:hypothetical protein [Acetobacteraceae bacterium]